MSKQPEYVEATFYAVIEPEWHRWQVDNQHRPILEGAKVERITKKRPQVVRRGGVVTRFTLRVNAAALLPLQPEAVITVEPGQVEVIQAVADNPDEEGGVSSGN